MEVLSIVPNCFLVEHLKRNAIYRYKKRLEFEKKCSNFLFKYSTPLPVGWNQNWFICTPDLKSGESFFLNEEFWRIYLVLKKLFWSNWKSNVCDSIETCKYLVLIVRRLLFEFFFNIRVWEGTLSLNNRF